MNLCLDFVFERRGSTRVAIVRNYDLPMREVMKSLGIEPNPEALFEVSFSRAIGCLTILLWKDLAYSLELMPKDRAEAYAKQFVEQFSPENTRFFTNGDWDEYDKLSGISYSPLTPATFSAVLMGLHSTYAIAVVIEDED